MRRLLIVVSMLVLLLVVIPASAAAQPAPVITFDFLNPPEEGLLELAVGESVTFDIRITSNEPFIVAMVLGDQYYPGRGVFFRGNDIANQATSAVLHLTTTGKEPTDFLPDGVAPVGIVAGVRYQRGVVVSERFDFVVRVVEP